MHFENLKKELDKSETELKYLRHAHGKLQKVLTDKGTELSQAVRRAEVYEREAKKLRHKVGELKKQQQFGKSSGREQKQQVNKIHTNEENFDNFQNIKLRIDVKSLNEKMRPDTNRSDGIYDEVEHDVKLSAFGENEKEDGLQNLYDIPDHLVADAFAQDDVKNQNISHVDHKDMTGSSQGVIEDNKIVEHIDKITTDQIEQEESNNEKSAGINLETENEDPAKTMIASCYNPVTCDAIYATVDMEKKRNVKKDNVSKKEPLSEKDETDNRSTRV